MDAGKRRRLVEAIRARGALGDPSNPATYVTLEAFFEGNDDPSSFPAALEPQASGRAGVPPLLAAIRARAEVRALRVVVAHDADGPAMWPAADSLALVVDAAPEAVAAWFGEAAPDAVGPDGRADVAALLGPSRPPGAGPVVGLRGRPARSPPPRFSYSPPNRR
ncbi:hypothetical protein P2H44_18275 [Albimonas sp. CAU 1670]|uniref:hypothetical protein n=1 Tax=Albimonas sp. CAU 1670 TaxID=3032599 RepID=UPI0023DA77E3|nr:hypothetical protein [Albimonas sp. CAU 1670]MDF2234511.1 hypothetical protein [Albimonas sp. CAU 1670]